MSYDLFAQTADAAPATDAIQRLFFGLMTPEAQGDAALSELAASRAEHGLHGNAIRKDRLHITLIHVGDYAGVLPSSVTAALVAAGDSLSLPGFDLTFDRVGSFSGAPGRYPHVLLGGEGLAALRAFRSELLTAVIRQGVKPLSRQEFNPHVTLAYADRRAPERPIRPITWRASEFVLIHSEVGRSIYHTLGRWPLH